MAKPEKRKRQIQTYSKKRMLEIVRKVCENYAIGEYTLESVCQNAGVPYRTFKHWWSMYDKEGSIDGNRWAILAEVADLWTDCQKESKEFRVRELVERSEQSLLKKVTGYYYEVDETIFKMHKDEVGETLVPVGIKRIKKHSPPSDSAIQFVLKNRCPEKYGGLIIEKDVPDVYDTSKYKGMSLEELEKELDIAKEQLRIINEMEEYDDDNLI